MNRAKMTEKQKREALNELKMLRGLPPHDDASNYCRDDAHFARGLEVKYGMSVADLQRVTGFNKIKAQWDRTRDGFLASNGD